MEAEKRLEPVSYEAEWAYLPCYDDLGKKSKPIVYVPAPDCSGRMKISRLGGREENFAEWSEVYSEKGGNYEMTISTLATKTANWKFLSMERKQYSKI